MDENLKAIQAKLDEIQELLIRAQCEMAAVRRLLTRGPEFKMDAAGHMRRVKHSLDGDYPLPIGHWAP